MSNNINQCIYDKINSLASNWYKDDLGRDLYNYGNLSIGHLIESSAIFFFSSIYREYYSHIKRSKMGEKIFYNEKEHPIRLMMKNLFTDLIEINNSVSPSGDVLDREFNFVPGKKIISKFLLILQKPLLLVQKRKPILYLSDWTYSTLEQKNNNSRFLNSKNLRIGAYLNTTKHYLDIAELYIPLHIDKNQILERLILCNNKMQIDIQYELLELFADYIFTYFNKNRSFFIKVLATYEEMLDRYKPDFVVFPGELYEPYILIRSLCEKKGIKSIFMLDGFSLFSYYPNFKNNENTDFIFSKYIAFGQLSFQEYLKRGLDYKKIQIKKWPVLYNYDENNKRTKIFDCIVMTWIPFANNPEVDIDSPKQNIIDVVELLEKIGFKKIAIKIKHTSEEKYINKILKSKYNKISILKGPLYKHLYKSDIIIGGISSAVVEARYCNIPYFIYEPISNGYPNSLLFNSTILSRNLIARTIEELHNNILNKISIMVVEKIKLIHNDSEK
jgi:hypothetical protein